MTAPVGGPPVTPPVLPAPEDDLAPVVAIPADTPRRPRPVISPVSAPAAGDVGVRFEAGRSASIDLDLLLRYVVNVGGSDLHLAVGAPPLVRVNGDMQPIPGAGLLAAGPLMEALTGILTEKQLRNYQDKYELDTAHTIEGVSRFRVNILKQRGNPGAVFRVIPNDIQPLEKLGLPPVLYNFSSLARGLVLVTGPTGSGKSTTLASLIDRANRTRSGHIITIEDPIEFIHANRSCLVNQREVGTDTESFQDALRHVLRQDPDIIFIGEMRDLDTISVALTAAETGHLVFATLHTQSSQETVNRIIDVFPAVQQQQIRSQLAATLRGVVCQTLVKRADGKGRVPACEILVVNTAISTMIRRDETHQINQALQAGGQLGMQTLNQHLAELVRKGLIERSTAVEVATDVKDLDALIAMGNGQLKRETGKMLASPGGQGLSGSSI